MNVKMRSVSGVVVEYIINGVPQPILNGEAILQLGKSLGEFRHTKWPVWAKAFKLMSKPEDKGIGDVVARLIGNENSEQFKSWYKSTFNKDCNCKGRQDRWNRLYPLK